VTADNSTKETNNKKALGTTTQSQQADLIIRSDMNSHEAEHAYNLNPWHSLVHLALASLENRAAERFVTAVETSKRPSRR
jgi:hypothetical protein